MTTEKVGSSKIRQEIVKVALENKIVKDRIKDRIAPIISVAN